MTKEEIVAATEKTVEAFSQVCNGADDLVFFKRQGNKWSVAENIQHLIISFNTTTLAYSLPRIFVRWIGGKPNRPSRSYEALVDKYKKKLEDGGKAGSRFTPKKIEIKNGKEKILSNWNKATSKYITALKKNRDEKDLDNYLVRHPLLGRITLRELCYFSIYHTAHHLNSIRKILNSKQ